MNPITPEALSRRIARFMASFREAQHLEARSADASPPYESGPRTVGLVCGVARGCVAQSSRDADTVAKAVRHYLLARSDGEALLHCLMRNLGNDELDVWSEVGEAAARSTRDARDCTPVLLEFAQLLRRESGTDDTAAAPGSRRPGRTGGSASGQARNAR